MSAANLSVSLPNFHLNSVPMEALTITGHLGVGAFHHNHERKDRRLGVRNIMLGLGRGAGLGRTAADVITLAPISFPRGNSIQPSRPPKRPTKSSDCSDLSAFLVSIFTAFSNNLLYEILTNL